MIRLRYVFLFILLTALGAFALGLLVGFSADRVLVAGDSVKTWVDRMSLEPAAVLRPVASEDIDAILRSMDVRSRDSKRD